MGTNIIVKILSPIASLHTKHLSQHSEETLDPIYEEIDLSEKPTNVAMKPNLAYEDVVL